MSAWVQGYRSGLMISDYWPPWSGFLAYKKGRLERRRPFEIARNARGLYR
jgi:hypothetical protein